MKTLNTLNKQELIKLSLTSFEAERQNDVAMNAGVLHKDFAVIDMVLVQDKTVFPRLSGDKLHQVIDKAFSIVGREFVFKTIVADEPTQTVVVEFIESYSDPATGKIYRTPQVAICIFKAGKLYRTRHYMDPRLSYEHLSMSAVEKAFE